MDADIDYCRSLLAQEDHGLYLVALMMPRHLQEIIFVVSALDLTLNKIPGSVSNPTLGLIKLAWWRDRLNETMPDQQIRGEPVLAAIGKIFPQSGRREMLSAMVDEKEPAVEGDAAAIISQARARILQDCMGAAYTKFQALDSKRRSIQARYADTRWQGHAPFLALRLWIHAISGQLG